jgi:hypothetical protein
MTPEMQALVDAVNATVGVENSAVLAFNAINQKIVDLTNEIAMSAEDKAKMVSLTDEINAATAPLSAAVAANPVPPVG